MKNILFLFLFLPLLLTGQEYDYEITPVDDLFTLDVITEINLTRSSVQRTKGLDTVGLQNTQYTRINALYEQQARDERKIDNAKRAITNLKNSLDIVGEDYNNWQIERLDSTFTGSWLYRDENGTQTPCYVDIRTGQAPFFRRTSDNIRIFTLIARSQNYVQFNWNVAEGFGNGDTKTEMFSNDSRFYAGEDATGIRHVLRKMGQ